MDSLAIIVPCYNEVKRLKTEVFAQFAKSNPSVQLIFIDDGSKDGTAAFIEKMSNYCNNIHLIAYGKNLGKGNAIRKGMLYAVNESISYIGYIDADLSTPLDEMLRLFKLARQENAGIVLGSRIKKIDTIIVRSAFRHFIGRIIATIIDNKFHFNCYDTQCGAKIFEASLLKDLINQAFYTKWFFDVELLSRAKKQHYSLKILEEPLRIWKNVKDSKVNIFSTGLVLKDLYTLFIKY